MLVLQERKTPWYHRRSWQVALAVGIVATGFFFAELRRFATSQYREHRQRRALQQAQTFVANHDRSNALLALDVALQAAPQNSAAWQTAAEVLDLTGDVRALAWRRQWLQANPDSVDAMLALAATALRFNDLTQAESALAQVPAARTRDPAVLKLRAALAIAQGRTAAAHAALETLTDIEPNNATMRFNLVALNLRHGNAAAREQARRDLATIANSPDAPLQASALRELTTDAMARHDPVEAAAWADRLVAAPAATFADELLRIDIAALHDTEEAKKIELAIAGNAAHAPEHAAAYVAWLLLRQQAAAARTWLGTIPEPTRLNPTVAAAAADCFGALRDWEAMREALRHGAWGPARADAIDRAFAARKATAAETPVLTTAWTPAIKAAGPDLPSLRLLLRLATAWHWPHAAEQTLVRIVQENPDQSWAFRALVSSAYSRRDSSALKHAYDLWHRAQPQDARVAGDWAMLTLLLQPTSSFDGPKRTAEQLHAAAPDDPFFATAHAFARYQTGEIKRSVALMESLKPAELAVPGRTLYFGLFLARDGQADRARDALEKAERANVLPEEQELLRTAWRYVRGTETGADLP
jgi:tetratricopeptide (TPR) repeat protein